MKSRLLNKGITAIYIIMVILFIVGCSSFTGISQTPDQPSNESVTIEGVTVSDTQITFHGKSTLPDGACINTKLLADDTPLAWWPGDTCVDIQQGKWELKVSLEDNMLQAETQYVLHAYQRGNKNVPATFAFDLSGPPMPSE